MSYAHIGMRVAGTWLAIGSLLLAGTLVFHGPPAADMDVQLKIIADGATRWTVVHWGLAAALSLFAVAGLVILAAGSRLTESWWTMTAWATLLVGALWTVTTAVAEATAVTGAAVSGNTAMFEVWLAFAEGNANGIVFLALAIAVIAGNEARTSGSTPVWASWIAVVAGVVSSAGWVVGMWLGFGLGNLAWLVSSLVMSLWTLWFGVAITRTEHA
ncbi:MAG: hypothetical protein GEU73_10710 [Chloroflexi bacterium]|nr:hypothetical protein [Chloroflexota bacterium]